MSSGTAARARTASGDGAVTHDEFIAYQTKLFEMMDTNQTGSLGPQEFPGR